MTREIPALRDYKDHVAKADQWVQPEQRAKKVTKGTGVSAAISAQWDLLAHKVKKVKKATKVM